MVNRAVPLNFFKIALYDFGLVICIVFILLIRPIFAGECINGNCVNGYGTKIWPNGGKYGSVRISQSFKWLICAGFL